MKRLILTIWELKGFLEDNYTIIFLHLLKLFLGPFNCDQMAKLLWSILPSTIMKTCPIAKHFCHSRINFSKLTLKICPILLRFAKSGHNDFHLKVNQLFRSPNGLGYFDGKTKNVLSLSNPYKTLGVGWLGMHPPLLVVMQKIPLIKRQVVIHILNHIFL